MSISGTPFPNGSALYRGTILGMPVGTHVQFNIIVEDKYGNSVISSENAYDIISQETPWTIIIVAIGAIAAGTIAGAVVITRMRAKGKKKEYVAEELLPLPI
jgi:ABC-type dipeptide/oligopeptide/nickel transport system permease component